MPISTVNPFTNETLKSFDELTPEGIESAIATAHDEFARWSRTTFAARANVLHKVATLLRSQSVELSAQHRFVRGRHQNGHRARV